MFRFFHTISRLGLRKPIDNTADLDYLNYMSKRKRRARLSWNRCKRKNKGVKPCRG